MYYKLTCLIFSFIIISANTYAAELCGKLQQGEILVGKYPQSQNIIFNQNNISSNSDGLFLLAMGRDEKSKNTLYITTPNQTTEHQLSIATTAWDIQNIKGIPPRKVTPSDADLRDIEFEQKLVRTAQQNETQISYWQQGFIIPVKGRTSGNFGGQRIMNGVKKNPHSGMDIAASEGTPILAAGNGIITLAQTNLFYSGNVVIIDHGYGLHTIYAHLKDINVKNGDIVKQGEIIGTVGQTGRATGPHLHWGASVHGTKFNPISLLNINNFNDFCFTI